MYWQRMMTWLIKACIKKLSIIHVPKGLIIFKLNEQKKGMLLWYLYYFSIMKEIESS